MSRRANFDLANRLQNHGAPLGEVFSFMSGLYFRGKLAYANHFARPPAGLPGALIITSNRGLLPAETTITPEELRSFSDVYIDASEIRYVQPLTDSAMKILKTLPGHSDVVLLGSISTEKYAGPLLEIFDARLKFPVEFVGRGDMSRGGLMLRSIEAGQELEYVSLAGSSRLENVRQNWNQGAVADRPFFLASFL